MKIIIFITFAVQILASEYKNLHEPTDKSKIFPSQEPSIKHLKSKIIRDRRIAGGVEVEPHSHPYQVALRMIQEDGEIQCGGSVLSTISVLTAAHCPILTSFTLIIAGAHDITKVEQSQQRRLVITNGYRIHPDYHPLVFNSADIAILMMPTPFTYDNFVQPTRLPFEFANELFVNETARSTGWGTDMTQVFTPTLRKAYNRIMSRQECRSDSEIMLCVDASIGQGICSGDSGGVLTVDRPGDPRPVQIGIVSFGNTNCFTGYSAYVRTTKFLAWIVENQQ